jgi:geranyl-CoA carboxylase beta subunit
MAHIETKLSPASDGYLANREGMLALIERVRLCERRTADKSAASRPRFDKRGQLLPRERLSLLLDPGTVFLELSTLAGLGLDNPDLDKSTPGGGVIAGIGIVSGIRCMVNVSDSGIDAGALQPMGLDKQLRMQELALENKLPYVQLVESAGANLMAYRVEEFVRGGSLFRNLARMSAAGLPVVTVTHGSSTAGGAYQTGLSDYIVMVRGRSRAFLAGPPLLMAATGEVATEEELGGAEMHTAISGLGDYLAEDDRDAIRIAREILAAIDWPREDAAPRRFKPPRFDAEELLGVMPMDHKRPVDMKEVIARIADDSDFLEFGANYGPATVCGHVRLEGWPLGIVTNNGPIDPAGATKATHFIQACCQSGTPILYLNNTTGFMVGKAFEEAGIIKHGSKMIQAVSNATVPQITLYCGASFGAGNYGMCGRGFHPRFCFSWPNAKTAVMGGEQAAGTMRIVAEAGMRRKGEVDHAKLDEMTQRIVEGFDRQMSGSPPARSCWTTA